MMTDNVCEEFCSECWEELNMCACGKQEYLYPEFDYLFDGTDLHPDIDSTPEDPLAKTTWNGCKSKKKHVHKNS